MDPDKLSLLNEYVVDSDDEIHLKKSPTDYNKFSD